MVYAYSLMIARNFDFMPFTFWAQATFGLMPLLGSGHFRLRPPARNLQRVCAAKLWAQAIHLGVAGDFGLRPRTSDSQQNFGLTKVACDTAAVTYESLIAFIVRPQGQHGEISPESSPPRACSTFRLH